MAAAPSTYHRKCVVVGGIIAACSGALLAAGATTDLLDKTNCAYAVLADPPLGEPVVRDRRDKSLYGALANPAMRPLGGGAGYGKIVPRPTTVVRTADELRAALLAAARVPQTIYVDDAADIDLSYCARIPTPRNCGDPRSGPSESECAEYSLAVPAYTTLASGRGRVGSRGARLHSRTFTWCALLDIKGPGVRITGLRIHGPDSSIENDDPIHCAESTAIGATMETTPLRWAPEIDNNDLSSWPHAAVNITRIMGVRVHHNVIQFNRRREHNGTCGDRDYGLGYGVVIYQAGSATIEANVFDHNRHDIASEGMPGAYFTARYNLVLAGAVEHSFDVHGGKDRKDCTNIAGSAVVIHHNTFLQSHKPAVRLRGIPMRGAWVYKNETRAINEGDAFNQVNSKGNFWVEDNATRINRFPAWFISFGGASFWQWQQFDRTSMTDVATGDFNGDGAADLMRLAAGEWQWSKSGREGWAFLNKLNQPISQLRLGKFVGSTRTDVIRATGGEWQISEGGTSPWRRLFTTSLPLASAAFGDFAGDGRTDAFFADGTRWTVVQSFSPLTRRHYKQTHKLADLRFGNFVGDSKLDVLRSTGTEWLVWDHASQTWSHLNSSSVPLSQLTFADFDGDGFTDIARSTNGEWFVSWGGKSAWTVLNSTGQDLKSLVVADFNGDGKADVLSRQSPAP